MSHDLAFPASISHTPTPVPNSLSSSAPLACLSPLSLDDYEVAARRLLARGIVDFYAGGSGDERTLTENRRAYQRLRIRPRYLIDVSHVDTRTSILQLPLRLPVLLAPVALQCMAHEEGEKATARAAQKAGTVMVLSTTSSTSMEDVRTAAPNAALFFQLYVYNDRQLTAQLVQRAEACGFSAVVLTVDSPFLGVKERDLRNQFAVPERFSIANFSGALRNLRQRPMGIEEEAGNREGIGRSARFTWEDLQWLRSCTRLPLLLKGVLTSEDAVEGCRRGVAGIIVSNHGGRALDGCPATIDALPSIARAVREWEKVEGSSSTRVAVLVDGGVRRGSDVFKALALGADAVLIGRPLLWGLAHSGQAGVERVLSILREEMELCLALAGCPTLSSINQRSVVDARAMRLKL